MIKVYEWLQRIDQRIIRSDSDAIVIVVGDEGAGKSTLMLENTWLWQQIRDRQPTVDSVLDRVVHDDRDAFRMQLYNGERGDAHVAMDASHILFSKEAMHGDQIDVEKSLLDIRLLGYFIQLGYQDWQHVTDHLQRRRAKWVLRVPRRGVVWGYGRDSIDEKYHSGEWPEPDLTDTFPDLAGTELWEEFSRRDEERKRERLKIDEDPDPADARRQEQVKTVLRAVKPWDEERGMTQTDAAKLIDYSRPWVSDRIQEYRDGYYRDLLDDEETDKSALSAD
jgi:hypothetical protein